MPPSRRSIRELARTRPDHLYEGLLTVLMRLVFILYAEDRDLLPSRTDGRAREIYETSYSVRGLYARLVEDAALNPDTMDERRGGWGRLLALFRLIHEGHPEAFRAGARRQAVRSGCVSVPRRAGRRGAIRLALLPISDGCLLRVLEGLMTLQAKGGTRERLSYRTLDVEQIGSVYETVMGFTVETAERRGARDQGRQEQPDAGVRRSRQLAAAKGKDRIKFLKEEADRGQLSASVAKAVEAAKSRRPSSPPRSIRSSTSAARRRSTRSLPARRSCSRPTSAAAPAATTRRAASPRRSSNMRWSRRLSGSGRTRRRSRFSISRCAIRPWARAPSWSRPAARSRARLVEAWARYPEKKPVIPPDEDEELHARRLVAQRCLYGVDKNPLATDLAKLSLWLATLARDHEFTFLDHALKSGDSLVGLTQAQIAAAHWDTSKPGLPLFRQLVKDRVAEAMKGRAEIQAAPDDTARAIQEQRHRSLEARLKDIRLMGDAVIAAFFAEDKPKAREKKRAEVESWLGGSLEWRGTSSPPWPRP